MSTYQEQDFQRPLEMPQETGCCLGICRTALSLADSETLPRILDVHRLESLPPGVRGGKNPNSLPLYGKVFTARYHYTVCSLKASMHFKCIIQNSVHIFNSFLQQPVSLRQACLSFCHHLGGGNATVCKGLRSFSWQIHFCL